MIGSYNILSELQLQEDKVRSEEFLKQVEGIISLEEDRETDIRSRLGRSGKGDGIPHRLDGEQYFSTRAIQAICVKHRLRFLDSALFKGEIPYEAVQRIKSLEAKHEMKFKSFKIVAPGERFRLKDSKKDPILLAETENDDYLYIHQWGTDMKWYQRLLYFPLSNIQNLAISSFVVAFLLSFLVPSDVVPEFYLRTTALTILFRAIIFFTLSGLIFTFSLMLGVLLEKDFSEDVWNDPYFN
jgi:hypothetical protein